MEMPLTTKNVVCVTSMCAPRAKMARTCTYTIDQGRVATNLGYKNHGGYSGD